MPLLILVGATLGLVLILNWVQTLRLKRHTAKLRAQAQNLGLQFSEEWSPSNETEEDAPQVFKRMSQFLLFSQGRTRKIKNVMWGRRPTTGMDCIAEPMLDVAMFEFTFTTPLGKYVENWRHTVVLLTDEALSLPTFLLAPEPIFDAMLKNARDHELRERLEGSAGVSIKGHTAFNEATHIHAEDRPAVRSLFSEELVAFYEEDNVICTEGRGTDLAFYRYDDLLKPEDIEGFLAHALDAYSELKQQNERMEE